MRRACGSQRPTGQVDADVVVVAVPVPLLRALTFDPPLPGAVVEALASIRMSVAAKLAVPLNAAVAARRGDVGARALTGPTRRRVTRSASAPSDRGPGRHPVVTALGANEGPETWIAAIREPLAGARPRRGGAVVTTWLDDPWTQGAYSVLMSRDTDEPSLLTTPVGRIVFAGEHTSPDWSGTIEGALRSGERAAPTYDVSQASLS